MNDDELLNQLVAGAVPLTEGRVASFDLERAEVELMEEIMASPVITEPSPAAPPRRRRLAIALAGTTAATVLAVAAVQFAGSSDDPQFSAEAIAIAESSPRLLLTEPGWEITRADELMPESGLTRFNKGDQQLQVTWMEGDAFEDRLEFHDTFAEIPPTETTALGRRAVLYARPTGIEYILVVAPTDGLFIELSSLGLDQAAFLDLVGSLTSVSVEEWLSALPPEVAVRPGERAAVVDQMLDGVSLPDSFDIEALRQAAGVAERSVLRFQVAQAVDCAWVGQWFDARESGDAAAEAEALDAMRTRDSWPVVEEIRETESFLPDDLPSYADQMEDGTLEPLPDLICG